MRRKSTKIEAEGSIKEGDLSKWENFEFYFITTFNYKIH